METEDQIEAEASYWVIEMDEASLPPEQQAEFERWLARSPQHRAAFEDLRAAWRGASVLQGRPMTPRDRDTASFDAVVPVKHSGALPRSRLAARLGGFAALVVIAGVIVVFALRPQSSTYATEVGDVKEVPLPDGSMVHLNTNSQLDVEMTESVRTLRLVRGEALFKVVHDARRKFDVEAGDTELHAVGTEFSVKRIAEGLRVLVKEGQVTFNSRSVLPVALTSEPKARIYAGEEVTVRENTVVRARTLSPSALQQQILWTQHRFNTDGMTVAEAVAEINRYNRTQIKIDAPEAAARQITGTYDTQNVDGFVKLLSTTYNLRPDPANKESNEIRLIASPPPH